MAWIGEKGGGSLIIIIVSLTLTQKLTSRSHATSYSFTATVKFVTRHVGPSLRAVSICLFFQNRFQEALQKSVKQPAVIVWAPRINALST